MTIDEIWKDNAYRGLWGEVVEADIYKMKQLKFVPDVIFDIGANVGTFSKFAHDLYPQALIVAIEPDKENIENFNRFNKPSENNVLLHNMAIGNGEAYRDTKAANGSHECYLSRFLGYEDIAETPTLQKSEVKTVLLDFIVRSWVQRGQKYVLKIDIEGSETAIFTHEPSMEAFRFADYIAMELHYFAMTPNGVLEVMDVTNKALESLKATHDTQLEGNMFYAIKR